MILRIVQMSFKTECISDFQAMFEERKETIRSFPGCHHLELWQDTKDSSIFFTYSIWEQETNLNNYRFSEFFKETWGLTKAMFSAKAQAWSVVKRA